MKRKIITIDETKCNGCGLCVQACHEGAIALVDGKARLISESYCDGLGACLPHCPTDAIAIEEREAEAFDEAYALKHQLDKQEKPQAGPAAPAHACACPGTASRTMKRPQILATAATAAPQSQLGQWPCQIKLAPVNAPYFQDAHLLIAASCTAYAYANLHGEFMRGKVTLIGCTKLDGVDYCEKLGAILSLNEVKSVTVVRMEVPCCGGIVTAVRNALMQSGKMIPWRVVTISTDGNILED
jgi:NAD-dependent dihydropyrimidine dehydrogenase PreA subunit